MREKTFLYNIITASLTLIFLFSAPKVCVTSVASGKNYAREFYYFNPDSPQSNLGQLKSEFEAFFFNNNFSFSFQPFTHFVDFHRLNSERRPAFIIVPEWYLQKYGKELGLHPLLIPVRNGSTSYEKILLVSKASTQGLNDYDIVPFAMTPMGSNGQQMSSIQELIADELISVQQLNIINVPKDLDAILALVLGQVKMALVARDNLQIIADVNPRIAQSIRKLDKSITVSMPVLCYLEGRVDTEDIQNLLNTFKNMSVEQPRNKIMEMLQIDDWRNFTK